MTPRILLLLSALMFSAVLQGAEPWISLFDGKTLDGWKANEGRPDVFTVEDGSIKVNGGRAHLFYVGKDGKASFKNFVLRAKVKTTPGGNSGIYFHTVFEDKGWPSKGFECQVNSTHTDRRKTGSLYAVKDVMDKAPSKDGEWFEYEVRVEGARIVVKVDGQTTVDWTQPEKWVPPEKMPGRVLGAGTFALQGHDPKSVTYYKDIAVLPLE